ncbi:surface carbohydrate biosynthesis protein [Vibrio sp. 10N.261.51.F12]|uniref:surface carbohydrate biosynthesis protein n=1 Tax=Vibrio sp. 10N.261.51.F12 TaxID=3229679 RepID=UPI0035525388
MTVLYLPVEVKKREYKSRLAVGLACLQEEINGVCIGRDQEIIKRALHAPGVILLKSAASFESRLVGELKQKGNIVLSLDEEGVLPPLNDPSVNTRFSSKLLEMLDRIFINGPLELKAMPEEFRNSPKLVYTGNPRFDFYKSNTSSLYKDSIAKINELVAGKKIILIVSRFGDVNPAKGLDYLKLLNDNGYIDDEESEKFFYGFYDHSKLIFDALLDVPKILSENLDDHIVVIRPHPSEGHELWQELTSSMENVIVNSDFEIASWLHACEVMIHNGCTTAIEATAIGKPVISFVPVENDTFDLIYANNIGVKVKNTSEVINLLAGDISLFDNHQRISRLNEVVFFSDEEYSFNLIAKEILELAKSNSKGTAIDDKVSFDLKELIRFYLHKLNLREYYHRTKFTSLSKKEIYEQIQELKELFDFESVSVKKVGIDSYLLTKVK